MSELIEKQKVLDVLREIATEKFSLDDPYGVYINVLIDVEEKICSLPVVQSNGPDNLVKDSQGLAKELVNDCISRRAAIDAIKKCRNESDMPDMWYDGMSCALRCIYQLSSSQPKSYREGYQAGFKDAQPERKRGKWEPWRCDMYKCSECSCIYTELTDPHRCGANYCPNCGADMREVDDGSD